MMAPMPAPQAAWAQSTGQMKASGGKTEIVGEITIRSDAGNFLAEVSKGPGLPLLKIYAAGEHPNEVIVRGALARGGWKGHPLKAPEALQAWAVLPEVFHWARAQAKRDGAFAFSIADVKRAGRRAGDKVVYLELQRGVEKIVLHLDP